jgi:hypothetical protein
MRRGGLEAPSTGHVGPTPVYDLHVDTTCWRWSATMAGQAGRQAPSGRLKPILDAQKLLN